MIQNENKFPRALNKREKEWLFFLLPEERKGYNYYRKLIDEFFVVGEGRFGGGNLYLGKNDSEPDHTIASSPVFAAGTIFYKEAEVYIIIHEEAEGMIEIDISNVKGESIPEELTEIKRHTYSTWKPGQSAPPDNSAVREVQLIQDKIIIAIASSLKRIWVYDSESGVNHFIPVSKFHNELMRVKRIKDPKTALDPNIIFKDDQKFSDEEIGQAFLLYNKYWKKIDLDYSLFQKEEKEKKKSLLSRLFFRRS